MTFLVSPLISQIKAICRQALKAISHVGFEATKQTKSIAKRTETSIKSISKRFQTSQQLPVRLKTQTTLPTGKQIHVRATKQATRRVRSQIDLHQQSNNLSSNPQLKRLAKPAKNSISERQSK
jgi:hypothetical protein